MCRLDSFGSGCEPVASSCKHSNEPLGSIKDGAFLDHLRDYLLLRKVSAQWS
jgi:hypothetical protein